jgi:hypothetical protein
MAGCEQAMRTGKGFVSIDEFGQRVPEAGTVVRATEGSIIRITSGARAAAVCERAYQGRPTRSRQ